MTPGPVAGLTRRTFLGGCVGAAVCGVSLEGFVLEPRRREVTYHSVGSDGSTADPIRIVQLTDLHLGPIGPFHEGIADDVRTLRPDVIVITGDALDAAAGIQRLETFLRMLPEVPHRLSTLGNWEYWSEIDLGVLKRVYEEAGWNLLVNQSALVTRGNRSGWVVGLDDLLGGSPDFAGASRAIAPATAPVLVVSHCPAGADDDAFRDRPDIDFVLSGHTHGGQVAVAGWAPLRPPGSGRYTSGWYRGDGPDLYVSRGLGTSVVPVRFGCVPEIACFDWFARS